MPEEYDNDLLKQGIFHFKSKDFSLARRYFERALDMADDLQTRAQANYYLSQVTDDPGKQRRFLEETLAIDMGHAAARRALAILDGKLNPATIVNPDALSAPTSGTQVVQAERFICSQCGGRMVYTPDGNFLVCEYCNRSQNLNQVTPGAEQDFFVAMANGKGFRKTISVKTFRCQGCGASFLLPPVELSVACAYCGAAHVIDMEKEMELVEPDAIIPMAIDRQQALLHLGQWIEKNHLQSLGEAGSLRGFYLPVWAFNLIGSLPWSGRIMRGKLEVPVSGESPAMFYDVCIPASQGPASVFPELIPGYSLATAPAYDPRFLAGWPAEVHTTTLSDAALEARHTCVEKIRRNISTEHGNVIDLRYSTSAISITSYRLILLPAWVAEYAFEDRIMRLVINGQTGSVHRVTPSQGLKNL
jgi:DNA-directed RNA polymerase subunit RPC12/RpoP